ncbi:hypothetical protein KAU86_05035, partial [bacterium]|nr:hypothetical protein [bacterium]
ILELTRYANVHTQKPLTNDELKFIAKYPEQAKKIMTVAPLVPPKNKVSFFAKVSVMCYSNKQVAI